MRIKCHGASQVPSMGLTRGCIRDKEKRPEAKLLAEEWSRIGPQVAIAPTPVSLHGPVDTCLCLVVTRLTPEGELLGTASSWAIAEGRGQGGGGCPGGEPRALAKRFLSCTFVTTE